MLVILIILNNKNRNRKEKKKEAYITTKAANKTAKIYRLFL